MTADHRRLVALAAVLAPGRAALYLARLAGEEEAATLAGEARGLVAAPRRARLAALAASLPLVRPPPTNLHPALRRLLRQGRSIR